MRTFASTICQVLLLFGFASGSWAEVQLFDTRYEGKLAGLTIETRRSLTQLEDGTFVLKSKASNFMGSLSETSHFIADGTDWRPLKYTYQRRILGARTTETLEFDWQGLTAFYTHSGKPERDAQLRLTPGVLDPALYQLRLQRDLFAGEKVLDYRFAKRDRIRHYLIEHAAVEDIRAGGKTFSAIKVKRAETDDDKQTYVWLIPDLYYLLGKIVHVEDDGDAHQMILTHYKFDRDPLLRLFSGSRTPPSASNTATN